MITRHTCLARGVIKHTSYKTDMAGIADHWKAFSGFNNRDGLLIHPINTDFRRYLIHYGERVGAIGDGFNNVKASNSFALSRHPPEELFSMWVCKMMKGIRSWGEGIFWFAGDEQSWGPNGRKIFNLIWYQLLKFLEVPTNPKMHHGFHSVYLAKSSSSKYNKTSAREQVVAEVRRLVDKYAHNGEDVSITVAGHSLGAALATLNAMDMVSNGYNKPAGSYTGFRVTVFAYASPRLGDKGFQDVFNGLANLHVLRIKNEKRYYP